MPVTRKRLSPEESRVAALDAARELLLEAGPQAVTLKAVAGRIGRTHANLLHHFGSAAALQKALAGHLARKVTATIGEAARRHRASDQNPREIVDLTFDAFDRQGAGQLVSWMILTGNDDALDPDPGSDPRPGRRLGRGPFRGRRTDPGGNTTARTDGAGRRDDG